MPPHDFARALARDYFGDYSILAWQEAGIDRKTSIIRTIKRSMIHRKLGVLVESDLRVFSRLLRRSLDV